MLITQQNWADLLSLDGSELKSRVFSILQQASIAIQENGPNDPNVLEVVPRLAALADERPELKTFAEAFSSLARATGLWNYIDKDNSDCRDLYISEAVTTEELGGITFHKEQIAALNILLSGGNLVLSAPTSFGKSILIDALIASQKYKRIAIVLPTIALLDEFRRRLASRFGQKFRIIMFHSETTEDENVIFLGTQERLLNREDLGFLDLVVVDEFYKLDPKRQDERSLTLNAAVYKLLNKSKQFFFLGPNIDGIRFSPDARWQFQFLRTRFSTVAVDTFDLRGIEDKTAALTDQVSAKTNWPVLIFASSPDRANSLAAELLEKGINFGEGHEFAEWLKANFCDEWGLSTSIQSGIGVHHGRIPRAVAAQSVRLFDAGALPILICTSTLIEGVNTAAKTVIIYDKEINNAAYDFFTFSNIKGRAGRLGQHHIGKVYLFHAPPDQITMDVEPPLFSNIEDAPDEMIVHISAQEKTDKIDNRLNHLCGKLGLPPSELSKAAAIGIDTACSFKEETEKAITDGAKLNWSGWPKYPEILAIAKILCAVKSATYYGVRTDKQLAFLINKLRTPNTSMKRFFYEYSQNYKTQHKDSLLGMDGIFKFLRSCEYGLPQHIAFIELYVKQHFPDANYSLFTADLPRWFRPEVLKNLDEQGVPIQISERFIVDGDTLFSLSERLLLAARSGSDLLSKFEAKWVLDALDI